MDELSPQEMEQFKQMESQEAAEKVIIEAEKSPVVEEVQEQAEQPTVQEQTEEKKVSLAALHEERERRKVAEEARRQLEQNQIRMDERLKLINERLNPPAQPREIPDPDKDALGALKATAEEVKTFREFQQQQQQQMQQNQYVQDVMMRASSHEAEFMKQMPDYGEASVYLKKSRADELSAIGMTPFQIQETLKGESLQLADAAMKQGKNPAEMVYTLAKSRGYARTGAQVVQAQPQADAEKFAKIAQGQKANTSLGNVGSTPTRPELSGKDLLAMSEDQFSSWLEKLKPSERAKFLGA